jgi:hypothetical protein
LEQVNVAQSWTEVFGKRARPLADLPNVTTLHKGFRRQHEIAALRRERGLSLCPTPIDTQGVPRDEATTSGMVPIMRRVAAATEFANAFHAPQTDPQRFARVSQVAVACVRRDSGADQTIARERDWLRR